jgi:hypothetical protein
MYWKEWARPDHFGFVFDWLFPEVTLESESGSNTKRIALGPLPLKLAGLQALVAAAFRLPLGAQMSIAILDEEDI